MSGEGAVWGRGSVRSENTLMTMGAGGGGGGGRGGVEGVVVGWAVEIEKG